MANRRGCGAWNTLTAVSQIGDPSWCLRTFCHVRASDIQLAIPDGSSCVTNAALHGPPSVARRNHFGYAFHSLDLRSVEITAAPNTDFVVGAVDASAVAKQQAKAALVALP